MRLSMTQIGAPLPAEKAREVFAALRREGMTERGSHRTRVFVGSMDGAEARIVFVRRHGMWYLDSMKGHVDGEPSRMTIRGVE